MTDIEKLREIVDEIDVLISNNVTSIDSEFDIWYKKTIRFLYNSYGDTSIEYKEFKKISFSIYSYVGRPPRSEYVKTCYKGLTTAKGLLTDYFNDLQQNTDTSVNTLETENIDNIERIFTHFKSIAVQLSRRHDDSETLIIRNEYDVQDLLHALLLLYYDDIRREEWIQSFAGSSVRMDFFIPEIECAIEVKKTRESMTDKKLSEELIIDIEKYQEHPSCKRIYCFVYDPDMILRNPAAIKNDLEQKHPGIVKVFIES